MDTRYKDFPPGWGHLKLPVTSRDAALAGLALYAPCKRRGVWAQRAAWAVAALLGPSLLPGKASPWEPPMAADLWNALCQQWLRKLGPFDSMAFYQKLQAERAGLNVLLVDGRRPRAFIKLAHTGDEALDNEWSALERISRFRPQSFTVPDPLVRGAHESWSYLAVRALPPRRHRVPSRPPLDRIVREIGQALAGLPREPETPGHWTPMHGDFTPWNLRQLGKDALVLLDWEDAGFGPPGADEVLYRAASSALTNEPAPPSPHAEATAFWEARVRARQQTNGRDAKLSESLLASLRRMRPAGSER